MAEPDVDYLWDGESVGTTAVEWIDRGKEGSLWEIRFGKEREEEAGSKFRLRREGKDKDSEVRLGSKGRVKKIKE